MYKHRGRFFGVTLVLLTASCGTFLSLGIDSEDEGLPPPGGADGSSTADGQTGSGTVVVDKRDTGSGDDATNTETKDASRDADAGADADADADAFVPPPIVDAGLDAAYTSPGSVKCGCQTGFCTNGVCDPLVFITREGHHGIFTNSPTDPVPGVERADEYCQSLAAGAGFKGRFRAWIAMAPNDHPKDRIQGFITPYRRRDGRIVVDNFAGFQGGQSVLKSPINIDQEGGVAPDTTAVWTGLKLFGVVSDFDCNSWANNIGFGTVGIVNDCSKSSGNCDHQWSSAGTDNNGERRLCTEALRLYCIQSNEDAGP